MYYTATFLMQPLCCDRAVTIWRLFFHLLVALVEGYKTVYLCFLDSYTVTRRYWLPSLTLWQDAFKILMRLQMFKIQIILLRGNFNNFRPKNSWKCHKTYNRPLPWQQMSKRLNLFILFMCTQRPFTLQVYFLNFASYIEKLPETTIKYHVKLYALLLNLTDIESSSWSLALIVLYYLPYINFNKLTW